MIDVALLILANLVTFTLLLCMLQDERAMKNSGHLFRTAAGFVALMSLAILISPLWGYTDPPFAELAKHVALALMVTLMRLKQCCPSWYTWLSETFDRLTGTAKGKLREFLEDQGPGKVAVAFLAVVFVIACWSAISPARAATDPAPSHPAPSAVVIVLDAEACLHYAHWSRDVALMRYVGADMEKARVYLLTLNLDGWPVMRLLLQDLDRLWLSRAHPQLIYEIVRQDCARRGGTYRVGS